MKRRIFSRARKPSTASSAREPAVGTSIWIPGNAADRGQAAQPVITQALIRSLQYGREIGERTEKLRVDIRNLLEAGARVERGRLDVKLRAFQQWPLSWTKLAEIIGEHEAEAVRARIVPITARQVIIEPSVHAQLLAAADPNYQP